MRKTSKPKKTDNFIMLPTVDFCFKELMQDAKVRKGLIAALLNVNPNEIESTTLMPTILRKRYTEDKYGILDVRVKLKSGVQIDLEMQVESYEFWENRSIYYVSKMYTDQIKEGEDYDKLQKCIQVSILCFPLFKDDDKCYRRIAFCDTESGKEYSDLMELHVLELSKLPPEQQNETDIMKWMRFFGGKCEEDFKKMAEKDEYIGEAYEVLKNMSEDEIKRMEYEARQKAIRDYNSYMHSAERRGIKLGRDEGIEIGRNEGIKLGREALLKQQVKKKLSKGQSVKVIAEDLVEDIDVIQKIVDELDKE